MIHNWNCPDCGFGVGTIPPCECASEESEEPDEPAFGTHIKEAVLVVKDLMRR